MPVGDPLAPSAYFRPAPPTPSFFVQVEVISKAIKSMKPEQGAGVIGHLERGLAAEILQRMRAADAGAILGFLKPEVAAALAAEIVSRPPIGSKKDKEQP
jgi:flagellar motility protein MotE (MotC chaperone)